MGELKEAVRTKLTEAEATYALREGWKLVFGEYPSLDSLAILWAQSALETGRWQFIWNNNFGNIKYHDNHDYCMFKCNEVINGKTVWFSPPNPATWFCSYSDSVDGAQEYIEFVSKRARYQAAWAQIIAGNPVQYCAALKQAGYFTADLVSYTKGVVSLCNEFKSKSATLLDYIPLIPVPLPTPSPQPIVAPVQNLSFIQSIMNFIIGLFNPKQ